MTKTEALSIIFNCATAYQNELCGRNLLFICSDKHMRTFPLEVGFDYPQFLHLTGCKIVAPDLNAREFYNRCLSKRISPKDFEFAEDGTTPLKMRVLPALVHKNCSAVMVGDFNSLNPKLYTEQIVGGTKGCMGFVRDHDTGEYLPNTILNSDIRNHVTVPYRILVTYRKMKGDVAYDEIVYAARHIQWETIRFPDGYEYLLKPL